MVRSPGAGSGSHTARPPETRCLSAELTHLFWCDVFGGIINKLSFFGGDKSILLSSSVGRSVRVLALEINILG